MKEMMDPQSIVPMHHFKRKFEFKNNNQVTRIHNLWVHVPTVVTHGSYNALEVSKYPHYSK